MGLTTPAPDVTIARAALRRFDYLTWVCMNDSMIFLEPETMSYITYVMV